MKDFLVTWLDPRLHPSKQSKSKRFFGDPEVYVDGYIKGLEEMGMRSVQKNEV